MVTNTTEIYKFVNIVSKQCHTDGKDEIALKFENALKLGSSALEILGAIRSLIISERDYLEKYYHAKYLSEIVDYVDVIFGRK